MVAGRDGLGEGGDSCGLAGFELRFQTWETSADLS
jgi:hypothetical protein